MKLCPLVSCLTEIVPGWRQVGSTVQAALALGPISDPTSGTTSLKSLNTSEVHFLFGKIKKIDYQDEVLGFKIILYFTYV